MPDIFSSENVKNERVQIQRKHHLARRLVGGKVIPALSQPDSSHADNSHETTQKHRSVNEYSAVMKNMKTSHNPFASFVAKPFKLKFTTQAPGETVILLLRQHPVTQLKWIFMAIFGVFFPFVLNFFGFFEFLPPAYQTGAFVGWYLVLLGFIVESFLKWFYNVYIVTDERIIDVDFDSLLHRNISSAKIDNIQDTTARTAGFLSALFDFGTVTIQTAAEKREFEFQGVPHPSQITTLINDLILEEEREKLEGRVS